MKKIIILSFIIFLSFFSQALAQANSSEVELFNSKIKLIDAWLKTKVNHDLIPGISVSVFNKDSILWEKGYGFSNIENNVEMTPNTPLRVCSISKLFTALMIMHSQESGVININSDLKIYLENFNPTLKGFSPKNPITLKNILTHTSGLATEANIPYFIEMNYPSSEELFNDINTSKLITQPNSVFRYSNLAYSLAGRVIQKTIGKNYNNTIQEYLIGPLGLNNTYADIDLMPNTQLLGKGYGIRGSNEREAFKNYSTEALSPAAGLISSSHDLALLGRWIISVAKKSDNILKSNTINEMIKPAWRDSISGNKRGLGFRYYQDNDNSYFGHGGYCSGYRSVLIIDSLMNLGISVIMNVNDDSPYEIAYSIMNILNMKIENNEYVLNNELVKYEGIYYRNNMPIRSVISSTSNKLLVMDLFSSRPENTIWVLTSQDPDSSYFEKEGEPVEGELYFDISDTDGKLRFHRFYNYLTRTK